MGELIKSQTDSDKAEKLTTVLKIGLLLLLTFLKNADELSDVLNDLIEIANNLLKDKENSNWEKIFTDIILSQLSRGKSIILFYLYNL